MYADAAFGLQIANAHLEGLRRDAAARRLRRDLRRSAASSSLSKQEADLPTAECTFASALTELGGLADSARRADRSPDFEFAVVALIADLLDVAVDAGFDDVPAAPTDGDPFVTALRIAGRLAAVTATGDVSTDEATHARLQRRLERVRRAGARGGLGIVPTPTTARTDGQEQLASGSASAA